jgi:hypothetical protein
MGPIRKAWLWGLIVIWIWDPNSRKDPMRFAVSSLRRPAAALAAFLLLLSLTGGAAGAATTNLLVPAGALWSYLDDGTDQGTAWRAPGFDDSSWPWGFAELGYGDFDEETTLGYGGSPGNKHIAYYFRTGFNVTEVENYTSLSLAVLRDDGVVVYLNGTEIYRNNMPSGAVSYQTRAVTNASGAGEATFYGANVSPAPLVEGANELAVELHQVLPTSADISFDLRMTGVSTPPSVTRGPYLQRGGTTNITVRWRSSLPMDSLVQIGLSPLALAPAGSDPTPKTDHEIVLTGLTPNTRYYYSVGSSSRLLAGDATHFFVTAPVTPKPTRLWVIGDSGTADSRPRSVYNAYRFFTGTRQTDVWLMLGDNAYGSGTDNEYQNAVFNMFPELLRQTVMWSTIGNHETYASGATPNNFPFLHIYTQPIAGECGGVPSGTEKYYSFDYGNIHFVCLDANAFTSNTGAKNDMYTWLEADLDANTNLWLIAFWHHPPYTKGSHDSDTELELIWMRSNYVPLLESHGVDLVLCGHSHSYERSYLIDGHYGSSSTFVPSMLKDGGSGREEESGPYIKPTVGPGANQGAVYVVAGSSGQVSGGTLNHPAMYYEASRLGSMVIDIDGTALHAYFLRETGFVDDYFSIYKGTGPPRFERVVATLGANGMMKLAWWSRGDRYYQVERKLDLSSEAWTIVATSLEGTGGIMNWSTSVNGVPQAFYRVYEYAD